MLSSPVLVHIYSLCFSDLGTAIPTYFNNLFYSVGVHIASTENVDRKSVCTSNLQYACILKHQALCTFSIIDVCYHPFHTYCTCFSDICHHHPHITLTSVLQGSTVCKYKACSEFSCVANEGYIQLSQFLLSQQKVFMT